MTTAPLYRAAIDQVVPMGPRSRGWDHSKKCFKDRAVAVRSRDDFRVEIGTLVGGIRVRWKVRPCRQCGGFYVDCESRQPAWKRDGRERP